MSPLDDAVREGRAKYHSFPLTPPYTRNCETPRHTYMDVSWLVPAKVIPAKWLFVIYEQHPIRVMQVHMFLAECDQCHELRERLAVA